MEWKSTQGRALWAKRGLRFVIVGQFAAIVVGLIDYAFSRSQGNTIPTGIWLTLAREFESNIYWLALVVVLVSYVVCATTFFRWFFRSHRNIRWRGALKARHRPASTFTAWFVPFWLWFGPKKMINDLWHASDPVQVTVDASVRKTRMPKVFARWWVAWSIVTFFGNVGLNMENPSIGGPLVIVTSIANIPLAVGAMRIVDLLTTRQEGRRVMLEHAARG